MKYSSLNQLSKTASNLEEEYTKKIDLQQSLNKINRPLVHIPFKNSLDVVCGNGPITFARSSNATYIDRYGVLKKVSSDVPRFEEDGLLVEFGLTNLLKSSEELNNSAWGKTRVTISANATKAPDKTTTADGIIADSNDGSHCLLQNASSSDGMIAASCFFKPGSEDFAGIWIDFKDASSNIIGRGFVIFNLITGEYNIHTQTDCEISPSIRFLSNGWVRVEEIIKYTGSSSVDTIVYYPCSADSLTSYQFTGDGSTITTYAWGAQLENSPYCSSYIPTTTGQATRQVDACSLPAMNNFPYKIMTMCFDYKFMPSIGYDLSLIDYDYSLFFISKQKNKIKFRIFGYEEDTYDIDLPSLNSYVIRTDEEKFYVFVNGELVLTQQHNHDYFDGYGNMYFGSYDNSLYAAGGYISNFRIYDKFFTDEEIKLLNLLGDD